jgi:hypothetical protein
MGGRRIEQRSDLHAYERANLPYDIEAQHWSGHVQLHANVLLPFSNGPWCK